MQWHLSNPITISTSLPKKLRGTYGWVHHSELNNASSKAVAVLGQSSETVPLLICQNTPFAEWAHPYSSIPILPGEVKQLITNKKIHREVQHEGKKLGYAAQKTKAGYKGKPGHYGFTEYAPPALPFIGQGCLFCFTLQWGTCVSIKHRRWHRHKGIKKPKISWFLKG